MSNKRGQNTVKVTFLQSPGNAGVEYWAPLNWNGNIIERYSISTTGRIFDHQLNQYRPFRIDKDGYYICDIIIGYREYKTIRVHRFELMSFQFIPNFMEMEVNHKDGNKKNNHIDNLEWTTPMGNTRHGWDTGLNQNIGLNHGLGKYDDNTVLKICKLIDQGLTNAQICDEFMVFEPGERMTFNATISGIRHGKTHTYLSKDFEFMKNKKMRRYDLDYAHLVCNFLTDPNRDYTYKEIMDILEIPNDERVCFRLYIDNLIHEKTAKTVTRMYGELKKPLLGKDDYSHLMR